MVKKTRRDLLRALPALGLVGLGAEQAAAQAPSVAAAQAGAAPGGAASSGAVPDANFHGKSQNRLHTDFGHCQAFPLSTMPLRYSDAGAPTHDILRGTVPTGERVELHETTIGPGKMPHPAHQHPHEEFILVREGTVEFTYGGQAHLLGPGSVGYTAPNELHGFRNPGTVPATYFIFSLSKV